jgi:hypothetical protein
MRSPEVFLANQVQSRAAVEPKLHYAAKIYGMVQLERNFSSNFRFSGR